MPRVLQWVACGGRVSSVRVTTASTCASLMVRGVPERGASRERLQTVLHKALPPFAYRLDRHPLFGRHSRIAQAVGAIQHDAGPLGRALVGFGTPCPKLQFSLFLGSQNESFLRTTGAHDPRSHRAKLFHELITQDTRIRRQGLGAQNGQSPASTHASATNETPLMVTGFRPLQPHGPIRSIW